MIQSMVALLRQTEDDNLTALVAQIGRKTPASLTESRARALLIAANALDTPTLNDFRRLLDVPTALRVAVYDLLDSSQAALSAPDAAVGGPVASVAWLAAAMTAFANKLHYPVDQLDPSSPPTQFSPAGQVVHQTAAWVRRQVQLSATERDKQARRLAYSGPPAGVAIPTAQPQSTTPPVIPVRYFEYNDPVAVASDDVERAPQPPQRGEPIAINPDDLAANEPEIKILGESRTVPPLPGVPVPGPSGSRIADSARSAAQNVTQTVRENVTRENIQRATQRVVDSADSLLTSVRSSLSSNETLSRTRLKIRVMDYPNGHNLPSVQVFVKFVGSRQEVAGTSAQDGEFIVTLPARHGNGITYEVAVIWPDEFGGRRERKRITVTADRPEFELPFYARLVP